MSSTSVCKVTSATLSEVTLAISDSDRESDSRLKKGTTLALLFEVTSALLAEVCSLTSLNYIAIERYHT